MSLFCLRYLTRFAFGSCFVFGLTSILTEKDFILKRVKEKEIERKGDNEKGFHFLLLFQRLRFQVTWLINPASLIGKALFYCCYFIIFQSFLLFLNIGQLFSFWLLHTVLRILNRWSDLIRSLKYQICTRTTLEVEKKKLRLKQFLQLKPKKKIF